MKGSLKHILFYVALIVAIIVVCSFLFDGRTAPEVPTLDDVIRALESGKNTSGSEMTSCVVTKNNVVVLTFADGSELSYEIYSLSIWFNDENLAQAASELAAANPNFVYEIEPVPTLPVWVQFLPYLVVIVIVILLWVFMARQASGKGGKMGGFGRSHAKPADDKNRVTFADVAGADEEKAELEEVVAFLKDPAKFTKLGARIPRGVLLVGPPGTGKTLLAKAVAGEAGVPFFSISGSDFVEMYVGVGASRVRDLFEQARKAPSSIIFIDEIDAVGRHRGAGLGGGHDEREQTLNQLLVEMDGFGTHDGVIVMAATNRPDILDPALLRPGRFDRQVTVGYPDLAGRLAVLGVHAKGKPFESDVDLEKVAQTTVGMTGADLANLLNEAALMAARRGKNLIGMEEIEDASLKIIVGTPKKSAKIKEEEKKKTAYHEAGHAILAHVLPTQDPVRLISIVPSGRALGYTLTPPTEDKYSVYKRSMQEQIAMLLAGRAAEELIFDDVSGGASNDISRATELARDMVTKYGMSEKLGTIAYGSGESEVFLGRDFNHDRNYSEETAAKIDAEIHRIVAEAYECAKQVLRENMENLHAVAAYLVKHETMDDMQFAALMDEGADMERLEAMAEEKREQSRRQNEERARRQAEELARMKSASGYAGLPPREELLREDADRENRYDRAEKTADDDKDEK